MFQVTDEVMNSVKYAGIQTAIVIDNADPNKRGYIKVDGGLVGETTWIPYLMPAGQFTVPEIDEIVYIICDGGLITNPIAFGVLVAGEDGAPDSPSEFHRIFPTNRGLYGVKDGDNQNLIELDDGLSDLPTDAATAEPGIRIQDVNGNKIITNGSNTDKNITIETAGGHSIKLNDTVPGINIEDSNGNKIETAATGITVTDSVGSTITTSATGVTVEGSTGSKLVLENGQVNLIGATDDLLTLLIDLVTSLSTATYAGFGAPGSNVADLAQLLTKLTGLKAT